MPPKIQQSEFTTPLQLTAARDYFKLQSKSYKSFWRQPRYVRIWEDKILSENFPHQNFMNTANPPNNAVRVSLIIEILEGFYSKGLLKEEALKNLEIVKN